MERRMEPRLRCALWAMLVVAIGLGPRSSFASQADQQSPVAGDQERGVLLVELVKPLNSKNLQPGSVVEARVHVRQNGMSIPPGSKLVGHVVEAKARGKGDSDSDLKIVFDSINPPGNAKPAAIHGLIKAVAPNPDSGIDTGGSVGSPIDLKSLPWNPPATSGAPALVPLLNRQSTGVMGIKNLELKDDGLLTSGSKEVKLDGGTQLLLNVTVQ
jgi:hypothetical protein